MRSPSSIIAKSAMARPIARAASCRRSRPFARAGRAARTRAERVHAVERAQRLRRALDEREEREDPVARRALAVPGVRRDRSTPGRRCRSGPSSSSSPMNSRRKSAAVIEPPQRSPVCFKSATSLFSCSRSSSMSGMRHICSPEPLHRAGELAARCPRWSRRTREHVVPSATTHAPVSVALSTMQIRLELCARRRARRRARGAPRRRC